MKPSKYLMAGAALLGGAIATSTAWAYSADISDELSEETGRSVIGLGIGYTPDYEGSDEYEGSIAPFGRYNWESGRYVTLTGTGNAEKAARMELNLLTKDSAWELGPVLQYRLERDSVENDQVDRLRHVDAAVEMGGMLNWSTGMLNLGTLFVADVSDKHNGGIWYLKGDYDIPVNERFFLNIGVHGTWASDGYMDEYFSVTPQNRSGSRLRFYDADSGFKDAGASFVASYAFSKTWGMMGVFNYTRLLGDAKDSPLVDDEGDENQYKVFLGLTYSF